MIYQCGRGVAQKNIDFEQFNTLKIPLPPKEIQEKIVAEIELLEEKEQKADEKVEKLQDRISEIVHFYYSKEEYLTKIKDVAINTQYGSSKALNEFKEGFKTFRMNEIIKGKMNDNGKMKYTDISKEEFLKYKLNIGDILFNRTNSIELVGKTGIFNLEGDYCYASYLIRLKIDKSKAYPAFVNMIMNSEIFLNEARGNAIKAVKQANINAEKLKNFSIPIPPIQEQQKIVSEIEEIETKITGLEKELSEIPQQKEAVLKKYL